MKRRAQLGLGPIATGLGRRTAVRKDLAWWREARFGLFVHWGIFAVPAGVWRGRPVPDAAEVLMLVKKIPLATYARLAAQFHPRHWDAGALVRLAKDAGMKYLVITAKHHDGFAMYRSAASRFNVVEATPWQHDPMADLTEECRRQGLRLCFYYSQDLDWEHPDGAWNDWDFAKDQKQPERYLCEKVLPQVTELLTQYGPVGLIWFDMPMTFTREQGARIRRVVKRLQPHCLVCGRIGHDLGDYRVLRDNFLPPGRLRGEWEACATLNHSWGFKRHDHDWKSSSTLITTLVDLASKGANYLLNVGPDADGMVPQASQTRLRAVGAWLKTNGAAIHGTGPSPFLHEFPWGRITVKGRTLYLHFFRRPVRAFRLHGLRSRVTTVRVQAGTGREFSFRQTFQGPTQTPVLTIDFSGARFARPVTVIEVQLEA
ncbi:MAG: alpha-L-fucosidase, partial [Opitutales bacterium]